MNYFRRIFSQLKINHLLHSGLLFTLLLFTNCSVQEEKEIVTPPITNDTSKTDRQGPIAKGCPNAKYPDWKTSPYVLPYPVGKAYDTELTNCTKSFHAEGQPDQFAYDFNMDVGTLITASRAGKIVFVEERGGLNGNFPNNIVVVDHGDDTFAEYMHLKYEGAIVKKGDTVKQGDPIGYSGQTGLAGYPHLHFIVVVESWEYPYFGVPVTFRNTLSNVRGLASNTRYEAFSY